MGDKRFPGESALEALFGAIKSSLSSKQNQTLSTTIAGSSTVEGALQALEQSYSGLDYDELDNKPQINGVELSGNKTASDLGITIPTNLSDLNDDSTHRLVTDAEKSAWDGKADTADITNAIAALDVSSIGGTGKYISEISEADGKISATAETMDDVPTENSNAPVKSGGIKAAIDDSVSFKTATGNPITLTDAANANAEELSMTIEPIQDLHGYSKPWPAGGGKNIAHIDSTKIFNTNKNPGDPITGIADGMLILSVSSNGYIRSENLESYTINNPNSITAEMNDTEAAQSYGVGIVVEIDDTKTYTLSLEKTGGNVRIGWLNTDGSNLSYTTDQTLPCILTPPSGAKYLMIVCCPGRNVEHTFSNIQLEVGTSATTFEPWENICPISGLTSGEVETTDGTDTNTASISFGQTVYGGSVNFKTGEVTVTHGMVDLGLLTWIYNTNGGFSSDTLTDIKTGLCELICSGLSFYSESFIWGDIADIPNYSIAKNAGNKDIYVKDTDYTNAAAFKTAMSGVQLCYELATPTTLTLTPAELELLKGNNTITANGAEISLSYYPDNAIGALAERVDDKADITYVDNAVATKRSLTASSSIIGNGVNIPNATSTSPYITPHEGFVRFDGPSCLCINDYRIMKSSASGDIKGMWLPKGVSIHFTDGTPPIAQWFNCSND